MSTFTLAHHIPMELVNKILITRPRHPLVNLLNYNSHSVSSTYDIEGRVFSVINNNFIICISGDGHIQDGDVCKLDEQGRIDFPFARSGWEMVHIVSVAFRMKYLDSL
jgi:hypothetical protein